MSPEVNVYLEKSLKSLFSLYKVLTSWKVYFAAKEESWSTNVQTEQHVLICYLMCCEWEQTEQIYSLYSFKGLRNKVVNNLVKKTKTNTALLLRLYAGS